MSESSKQGSNLKELTKVIADFRDQRDWKQFHTGKDMILSLFLEVAELGEHLQWKSDEQMTEWLESNRSTFADELSDILYWVLLIAHDSDIDLEAAFYNKMKKNAEKYPVDLARGSSSKYTKLSKN